MAKCPKCDGRRFRSEVFDNYSTAGPDETRMRCFLIVCSSCDAVVGAVPDLNWALPKENKKR